MFGSIACLDQASDRRARRRSSSRYPSAASGHGERDRRGDTERRSSRAVAPARGRRRAGGASRLRSRARRAGRRPRRASSRARAAPRRRPALNRSRSAGSCVSTSSWRPVSGSSRCSSPTSASSCSRGSRISTASVRWRAASRSSGRCQSIGPRKSETTTMSDRCAASPPTRPQRLGEAAVAGRRVAHRAEREQQAGASLARTHEARLAGAERDDAEPVPAAGGDVADGDRDAFGDVGLAPVGGAEPHRRGRVEDDPRHEHPLGELDADVRHAGAGGDVPVDPAHVVARAVRPHLVELRPDARERRAIVAGRAARRRAARSRGRGRAGSPPTPGPGRARPESGPGRGRR